MTEDNRILKKIQEVELDALCELKKIFDQYGIQFYMRGGSVMGCVKYNGFVPWDDDIDIAVPRDDYEKMLKIFKNRTIADKYQLLSYRYCEELHSYIPRVFLLEKERERLNLTANTKLGLYLIDIFPVDGSPNNKLLRSLYIGKVYFYRLLACLDTVYDNEQINMHNSWQRMLINMLKILHINKLYRQRDIYLCLEKLYKKNKIENSMYVGTITASLMKKELMEKNIWGKGVYKRFEDIEVKVPEQYDAYLKRLYGENYRDEEPEIKKTHSKK